MNINKKLSYIFILITLGIGMCGNAWAQAQWGYGGTSVGLDAGWHHTPTLGLSYRNALLPLPEGWASNPPRLGLNVRVEVPIGAVSHGVRVQLGVDGWVLQRGSWALGGGLYGQYVYADDALARTHSLGIRYELVPAYRPATWYIGPLLAGSHQLGTHFAFQPAATDLWGDRPADARQPQGPTSGWYAASQTEFHLGLTAGWAPHPRWPLGLRGAYVLWPNRLGVGSNPTLGLFPFLMQLSLGVGLGNN